MGADSVHLLDNPAWSALTGPHAHLAEVVGRARRYPKEISPFVALPPDADDGAWTDLATLVGPAEVVVVTGVSSLPPAGWERLDGGFGVQMVDVSLDAASDPDARPLTDDDVPQMLDLVARAKPGPFAPRTIELGGYLGIFRDGALVAMAGQRMHPQGWIEISAVCTDAEHRGQGLAGRIVRAVAAGIRDQGDTPFLHAAESNTNAIRLYEKLGFEVRRRSEFSAFRTPVG